MAVKLSGVKQPVSAILAQMARELPPDAITVRRLLEQVGGQGLLAVAMVSTIPFLLPVSIPGTSTPFGIIIVVVGLGVAFDRVPWVPGFVLRRTIPSCRLAPVLDRAARLFTRLERLVHPRALFLTSSPMAHRLNAFALSVSGALLAVPLPVPLTNTFPGWAALLLAVGIAQRDGYFLLAGYVMLLASAVFFAALALGGFVLGTEVRSLIFPGTS